MDEPDEVFRPENAILQKVPLCYVDIALGCEDHNLGLFYIIWIFKMLIFIKN